MTEPKRPAMKDVAAAAGVSVATASRSFTGKRVDPATQQKVLAAAEKLGYRRDLVAQALRTGQTNTVGMVIRDLYNPLFANIAQGVERRLADDGVVLITSDAARDAERESELIDNFVARRVDGLILALVDDQSAKLARTGDRPVVLVDREVDGAAVSTVCTDHFGGVTAGIDQLVSLGHERIALIQARSEIHPMRERLRAYHHALDEADVAYRDVRAIENDYDAASAAARDLLEGAQAPTAIVCGGLLFTIGLYRVLHERGMKRDGDLDVLGCDTNITLRLLSPAAHFVARDPYLLGQTAAELLLEAIGGAEPRHVELPTQLLIPPHH